LDERDETISGGGPMAPGQDDDDAADVFRLSAEPEDDYDSPVTPELIEERLGGLVGRRLVRLLRQARDADLPDLARVWRGEEDPSAAELAALPLEDLLREAFKALHRGGAVQPPQTLAPFPHGGGDFITYLGAVEPLDVLGVKVSPYIPRKGQAPIITAWTLLLSMSTGLPLTLVNASALTRERTAATTALAVDLLAPKDVLWLGLIGAGPLAQAHLRRVRGLRNFDHVRVFSPNLQEGDERWRALKRAAGPLDLVHCDNPTKPIVGASVVLLCTSSGVPVIDWRKAGLGPVITSISTNAPKAHEIAPEALPDMNVYCDYRETTPKVAGEMVLAYDAGIWSPDLIAGDLPSLCAGGRGGRRDERPSFFRSVGLGLEDVVAALALYRHRQKAPEGLDPDVGRAIRELMGSEP
jgi:L-arginine dehydrogenase